jgi:hypothetical protein
MLQCVVEILERYSLPNISGTNLAQSAIFWTVLRRLDTALRQLTTPRRQTVAGDFIERS